MLPSWDCPRPLGALCLLGLCSAGGEGQAGLWRQIPLSTPAEGFALGYTGLAASHLLPPAPRPLQAEGITAGGEIARTDPTGWVSPAGGGDVTRAGSSLLTFRSDKCGGWGSAITPGAALPHRPESSPQCPVLPCGTSLSLCACNAASVFWTPPSPAVSSPFLMLAEVLWSSG